jgi:DNA-binding transcriptional LysR family regulator
LFRDRFVGVVRTGHPLAQGKGKGKSGEGCKGGKGGKSSKGSKSGKVTPARYAAGEHISVSREGLIRGPIDEALALLDLERDIVTIVGGFSTALALARASDLIATVPERHTGILRAGMHSFPIPVSMPEFTISLLWHPRMHADLAHRWLRGLVLDVCAATSKVGWVERSDTRHR